MPALTAILIAYNEELDLPRALTSLNGVADEIILVDSGSIDRTCEIARRAGARIFSRKLDGLAEQKNYAASLASNEWLLSIDCDEEIEPRVARLHPRVEAAGYEHGRIRLPPDDQLFGRMDPPFRLVPRS